MANRQLLVLLGQGVFVWNQWRQQHRNMLRRELDLTNVFLRDTGLMGIHLYDTDLRDAKLNPAELSGANLSRVDLRLADLRSADLTNANLSQAIVFSFAIIARIITFVPNP